ncbi:MAG: hypothetical protein KDI68_14065 [Gammaproteobacteria bacterium]|nr:hypothetical protein [Gammaproteobacteria bacterium]
MRLTDDDGLDPWPIEEMVEGRHFYYEGPYMVFTARYHRSRGSCCGSLCRHCPFGHEKVRNSPDGG